MPWLSPRNAFTRWVRGRGAYRRIRYEHFGAIVQLAWPRALVFVDRVKARSLGLRAPDRVWNNAPGGPGDKDPIDARPLSAPLEAHLQLTNQCSAGCSGCYTGASPQGTRGELGFEGWQAAIDKLAKMGVFHLALGGGESANLPWLPKIVEYARGRGLVPNLTTSGLENLDTVLGCAHRFGQINVSLDGLRDDYARVRGFDGFARAHAALLKLRRRTSNVGINVVITRHNFAQIDALVAYAKRRRLNEVEFLRFKPAGRGSAAYEAMRCTQDQHERFLPQVLAAAKKHRVRVRVDCSYTPMLVHHGISQKLLSQLMVYGCVGGDFLIGVKPNGTVSACSFASSPAGRPQARSLDEYWDSAEAFPSFRNWRAQAEPCASCEYHSLCRGGCHVVSRHVYGDATQPDPECPRVIASRHSGRTVAAGASYRAKAGSFR